MARQTNGLLKGRIAVFTLEYVGIIGMISHWDTIGLQTESFNIKLKKNGKVTVLLVEDSQARERFS
jgi:hypothetical protein